MSRWHSYLNSSTKIIQSYKGESPFSLYLKDYFRSEKKMGGTDRKWIRHFTFSYFRLGKSLTGIPVEDGIKAGLFLCSVETGAWIDLLQEDLIAAINKPLSEKLQILRTTYNTFDTGQIFPLPKEIAQDIDMTDFAASHLHQPDVFIRIRPGKKEIVFSALNKKEIAFYEADENCLAFEPDTKLDEALSVGKDVIIQDLSSQKVSDLFRHIAPKNIWDCCAGSGGKSILAKDIFPGAQLYVSDSRENILHNLSKRFREAGIEDYQLLIADLAKEKLQLAEKFDLVICDVPCSGSGTWGRSPENLVYFTEKKLDHYIALQKKIIENAIPQVNDNGYFLYITCSVYAKENDGAINFILQNFPFKVVEKKLLKGYEHRADTMFAALLQKI